MIDQKIKEISIGEIDNALRICMNVLRKNALQWNNSFEEQTADNGIYEGSDSIQQLSGLWAGELWLSFGLTAENCFRESAENLIPKFSEYASVCKDAPSVENAGFLFSPSCVHAWKLVKNEEARNAALLAADVVASRFRTRGQFIQTAGEAGNPHQYVFTLEGLLNLPLLFWARDESSVQEYREIAKKHLRTILGNCMSSDGSVFEKFYVNPADGFPVAGSSDSEYTGQSLSAYIQAEALLGTALCYRYDRKEVYLQYFRRLLSFYKSCLPPDMIPYWDLNICTGEKDSRDTAAAAIAACALLQMSENYCADVSDDETLSWRRSAKRIVKMLIDRYAVCDYRDSNGLLYSGSVRNKNQCTLRGDYFYLEALCRLRSPHFINCW
jgi:unsaturated chondroitin disaccharide hydrolase